MTFVEVADFGTRRKSESTLEALAGADAVVLVLSAERLAGAREIQDAVRDAREAGITRVFFLCNRFDLLRRQAERDRVATYARATFAPWTALGEAGIFCVSALAALEGQVAASGIPRFQQQLSALAREHTSQRRREAVEQAMEFLRNAADRAPSAAIETLLKRLEVTSVALQPPETSPLAPQ
jgi:hypothetical protein